MPARAALFLARAHVHRDAGAAKLVSPELDAVAATNDVFARFLAEGYAMIGGAEEAVRWLGVAVERDYINHPFLARYDPCFESLRGDPRFQELLEAVRERWLSFEP